jgi:hypothetical protein
MSDLERALEQQRAANRSGLEHYESFASHRRALTELTERRARSGARLCVLGAGNAFDLDLTRLLASYAELHLVDIDEHAVAGARERVALADRARVLLHAPIELSGMFERLPAWSAGGVEPSDVMALPAAAARSISGSLPGPFEVVLSACLLTQLQLSLLRLLSDRHPLFGALREFLTLTHLRTLAALTAPGGAALLATDLCEAAVFPPGRPSTEQDLPALMSELLAARTVIHASHPELLELTLNDDPVLKRTFGPSQRSAPWLWHNGPDRTFLVYALELERRS